MYAYIHYVNTLCNYPICNTLNVYNVYTIKCTLNVYLYYINNVYIIVIHVIVIQMKMYILIHYSNTLYINNSINFYMKYEDLNMKKY